MKPIVISLFIISAILAVWAVGIGLRPAFRCVFKPRKQALGMFIKTFVLLGFSGFFISMALIMDAEYVNTSAEWIKITLTLLLLCPGFGLLAGLFGFLMFKNHPFYYLDIDMIPRDKDKDDN